MATPSPSDSPTFYVRDDDLTLESRALQKALQIINLIRFFL